jgi:hypothetical protein
VIEIHQKIVIILIFGEFVPAFRCDFKSFASTISRDIGAVMEKKFDYGSVSVLSHAFKSLTNIIRRDIIVTLENKFDN